MAYCAYFFSFHGVQILDKILELYPDYDKVLGPYLRKDGRKHVVLNNSKLSRNIKRKTKTISYPKILMEIKLGRKLTDEETVDHIDEDFTNDDYSNLQILTRKQNASKASKSPKYKTVFQRTVEKYGLEKTKLMHSENSKLSGSKGGKRNTGKNKSLQHRRKISESLKNYNKPT